MIVTLTILVLFFSILLIWKGSGWITDSLVPVSNKLGTNHLAVTTLLVSFVISVPEIFTSVYAYLLGHLNIGLGLIIGSVMVNTCITVGLSATIRPLVIEKSAAIRDGIFLIAVAVIVLLFGSNLVYERSEGLVLLILFAPYALNVWLSEKGRSVKSRKEKVKVMKENLYLIGKSSFFNFKPSILTFVLGAGIITAGSYLFSGSLVNLSSILHVPELLVGIVVGGIGTGIPDIVAAIQGTCKGYKDAAISETFGSNIFTLLVTLGILAILNPFSITGKLFYFDLVWLIIINILMVSFIFKGYCYKEESVTRYEGAVLVLFYILIIVLSTVFFK